MHNYVIPLRKLRELSAPFRTYQITRLSGRGDLYLMHVKTTGTDHYSSSFSHFSNSSNVTSFLPLSLERMDSWSITVRSNTKSARQLKETYCQIQNMLTEPLGWAASMIDYIKVSRSKVERDSNRITLLEHT